MGKEEFSKILQGLPVELVKVDDIIDDPMNPNTMTEKQLISLEKSMLENGNAGVIVVNRVKKMAKPYMIVNGHQRLSILRKHGIKY